MDSGHGTTWPRLVTVVLVTGTALGLALRLYQLARPGYLTGVSEFDDGVYLGSALRLVHGVLPYKDYVLVQPPGITVLMTPVAALSRFTGTLTAMTVARVLTCLAGAASVPLTGRLARPAGPIAVVVATGLAAVYPAAITASHTVLLEPWIVLGCLIGAVAVFDSDMVTTSRRRLLWGGVALGAATVIKLWAAVPAVVLFVVLLYLRDRCAVLGIVDGRGSARLSALRRYRRAGLFLAGAVAGFVVPAAPFFAAAPAAFIRDNITVQFVRAAGAGSAAVTGQAAATTGKAAAAALAAARLDRLAFKLDYLAGLNDLHLRATAVLPLAIVIAVLVALAWVHRRVVDGRLAPLEWYSLASLAVVAAMFLWASDFYYHYAAFIAPYVALGVALPTSALNRLAALRAERVATTVVATGSALLMATVGFLVITSWAPPSYHPWGKVSVPPAWLVERIPPGACVVTENPDLTIVAGRFEPAPAGCPIVIDSYGTMMALTDGRVTKAGNKNLPALTRFWDQAYQHAQYIWLSDNYYVEVPTATMRYVYSHFRLIGQAYHTRLFVRRQQPVPAVTTRPSGTPATELQPRR